MVVQDERNGKIVALAVYRNASFERGSAEVPKWRSRQA